MLLPIAVWLFALPGAYLVIGFAGATGLSHWVSLRCAAACARAGRHVAGVLAASGIRLAVLLIVALMVVLLGRQYVPVQSVLLMVPLYLSIVFSEVLSSWRQRLADTGTGRSPLPTAASLPVRQR